MEGIVSGRYALQREDAPHVFDFGVDKVLPELMVLLACLDQVHVSWLDGDHDAGILLYCFDTIHALPPEHVSV